MTTPPLASPRVLISAFADEVGMAKTAVQQLTALAALGLKYYSPRWIDVSGQVKNVMALTSDELASLKTLHADFGMRVCSIGSPIGKVKLLDKDDGTHNRFVPFEKYLSEEVASAIERAVVLETHLIRGFSFYHPRGTDPWPHVPQVVDQLARIVEKCRAAGIVFGLEVEANLVGQNGRLLAEIHRQVASPHLVCVFDGGNICSQNLDVVQTFAEYEAMRDTIGWMHIKDYAVDPALPWTGVVDEERLKNFVPCDLGDSGHERILRDFREHVARIEDRLKPLGVPGVFLELEPHLKGGGQFGGFSGPDGLGVACRALCRLLDYVRIGYDLRTFDDVRAARGY